MGWRAHQPVECAAPGARRASVVAKTNHAHSIALLGVRRAVLLPAPVRWAPAAAGKERFVPALSGKAAQRHGIKILSHFISAPFRLFSSVTSLAPVLGRHFGVVRFIDEWNCLGPTVKKLV